jgi:hypothetical protein
MATPPDRLLPKFTPAQNPGLQDVSLFSSPPSLQATQAALRGHRSHGAQHDIQTTPKTTLAMQAARQLLEA